MKMKRKIWRSIGSMSIYDFECKVDDIIQKLRKHKEANEGKELELRNMWSDETLELGYWHEDLETDKEYANRMKRETIKSELKENEERVELARLKEKYEKSR